MTDKAFPAQFFEGLYQITDLLVVQLLGPEKVTPPVDQPDKQAAPFFRQRPEILDKMGFTLTQEGPVLLLYESEQVLEIVQIIFGRKFSG
jgi:hypothetical protein